MRSSLYWIVGNRRLSADLEFTKSLRDPTELIYEINLQVFEVYYHIANSLAEHRYLFKHSSLQKLRELSILSA